MRRIFIRRRGRTTTRLLTAALAIACSWLVVELVDARLSADGSSDMMQPQAFRAADNPFRGIAPPRESAPVPGDDSASFYADSTMRNRTADGDSTPLGTDRRALFRRP